MRGARSTRRSLHWRAAWSSTHSNVASCFRFALLKDINAEDLSPAAITDVNGTAFFVTSEPGGGSDLWSSDGTAAGSHRLASFAPVQDVAAGPAALTAAGGSLFFTLNEADSLTHLQKFDAATGKVVDIASSPMSGSDPGITNLVATPSRLFFEANAGAELHAVKLSSLTDAVLHHFDSIGVPYDGPAMVAVGDRLYFSATDDSVTPAGEEPWSSDGTATGTALWPTSIPAPTAAARTPSRPSATRFSSSPTTGTPRTCTRSARATRRHRVDPEPHDRGGPDKLRRLPRLHGLRPLDRVRAVPHRCPG